RLGTPKADQTIALTSVKALSFESALKALRTLWRSNKAKSEGQRLLLRDRLETTAVALSATKLPQLPLRFVTGVLLQAAEILGSGQSEHWRAWDTLGRIANWEWAGSVSDESRNALREICISLEKLNDRRDASIVAALLVRVAERRGHERYSDLLL